MFFIMPATKKPDPELLPIHRPRCPKCQTRMITVAVASASEGFERRTFECRKCGHSEPGSWRATRFGRVRQAGPLASCGRRINTSFERRVLFIG
jgi:uncharacterized protein with PIN domain